MVEKYEIMIIIVQTLASITVFVIPVIIIGIRIEHRLTKIETDVSWLKAKMQPFCKPELERDKE